MGVIIAGRFDFSYPDNEPIQQGADWFVTFGLSDSVINNLGVAVETPMDLEGYTGRCSLKKSLQSPDIIASPEVIIVDAAGGIVGMGLTHEETKLIPALGERCDDVTTYFYDVKLIAPNDGLVSRVLAGSIDVSPEATE